jgi:hypothetical protein
MNVKTISLVPTTKAAGIFFGIVLNLHHSAGRTGVLQIEMLPIHERGISLSVLYLI